MLPSLTTKSFDTTVATGTVLVVWGAEWHAPSNVLANRLAKMTLKATLYQVDVDLDADLAMRFSMRGIPTLTVFVGGQLMARETEFNDNIKALVC